MSHSAAQTLRRAIRDADGVEVFAIADYEDGQIPSLTVTCRGQDDRVVALMDRPRPGQVVVHNHPSGNLTASDADMRLAALYGDEGIGVLIVDNNVREANWVVEPYERPVSPLDPAEVEHFFRVMLPKALPGAEIREAQLTMAQQVCASLNDNSPLACEAGTGTGKSLAYLVPAALWGLQNNRKVVVSTFTRALQAQLCHSDLPMLVAAGIKVTYAQLQGRSNYVCKRRLGLAQRHVDPGDAPDLQALAEWEASSRIANRTELPFSVPSILWEQVESDSDLTLRVRCPHYSECHYYTARRKAASAQIIVVNHALLLSDLYLRAEIGTGVLPKYARLILDEGHHLEEAATAVSGAQVTARSVRRAVATLLTSKRRPGALTKLRAQHAARPKICTAIDDAESRASQVHHNAPHGFAELASIALSPEGAPQHVDKRWALSPSYQSEYKPLIQQLGRGLQQTAESLETLESLLEDIPPSVENAQPYLDLRRARKRLSVHAATVRSMLIDEQLNFGDSVVEYEGEDAPDPDGAIDPICRWVDLARGNHPSHLALLAFAKVEVADTLRRLLWRPFPGTIVTSATLTVAGHFKYWKQRVGLDCGSEAQHASPFDHKRQAVLGLPRDQPVPDHPQFLEVTRRQIIELVQASDGGAFVLCTSYEAVRYYAQALRSAAVASPILAQGESGRADLLRRFIENHRAVLVATDSFWEGVSVKGEGLRLVVIPRLPFKVPTEPLRQARYERMRSRGLDPFKAYALPEAVIKLRQGYGRLIRSRSDRGVVVILDRRIHERTYGALMLRSLPPARRSVGPWRAVLPTIQGFFSATTPG
jgi:ATP-dependent DNA helicase DinG